MPSVRVRENEPFEVALRRFKRTIEKTGLLTELGIYAALAASAVAQAAPIPVASYQFQTQDDVNAFQKVAGSGCKRKWVGTQALGIGVGRNTSSCTYRSSVVGDSSSSYSDQAMVATAVVGGGGSGSPQL